MEKSKPTPSTVKVPSDDTLVVTLTVSDLRRLIRSEMSTSVEKSEWLDEDQLMVEFGMGKSSCDRRGIPRTRLGRKNRWKRSDVENSINTEPVNPRPKVVKTKMVEGLDEIDSLILSGSVKR